MGRELSLSGTRCANSETDNKETGFHEKEDGVEEKQKAGRKLQVRVDLATGITRSVNARVYVREGRKWTLNASCRKTGQSRIIAENIVLDESMAMVDGMGLSNFNEVVVLARLSQSGIAAHKVGDYEAISGVINLKKIVK